MKILIDELEVIFPYQFLYSEQLQYMKELKRTLDQKGHAILEMPTGTGKTVSLLALIIAYLATYPDRIKKLIYCTRTVVEMEKTLKEVKLVLDKRAQFGASSSVKFIGVGLSARRNLCVHPDVGIFKEKNKVDAECRKRTAEWVYTKKNQGEQVEVCQFFDNFRNQEDALSQQFEEGVYSLDDLKQFGAEQIVCPYYLARKIVKKANIVVYNYLYLLDPAVASLLSKDHRKDSVVVFDEAHNIDDVCIEAYTIRLNKPILLEANNNIDKITQKIQGSRDDLQARLADEYNRLLQGLQSKENQSKNNQMEVENDNHEEQKVSSVTLPSQLKQLIIPGNIRQASHFIDFMKRLLRSLRLRMKANSESLKTQCAILQSPESFLQMICQESLLDREALKTCGERLHILLNTLQISETDQFSAITLVAQFAQFLSTYSKGFKIVFQTGNADGQFNEKFMTLACFDSSLAMKYVFQTFQSVVLTSGTMSPLDIYPRILDFKPVVCTSIDIDLVRNSISPIIVTMAEDGTELTSEYTQRNNEDVSRNYGQLLVDLSETVPDGMIVFMPSYNRMEEWARVWEKDHFLEQVAKNKLLFIESKDVAETSLKLQHFRRACDIGRGAALFSIARGKIAEGIDFEGHYGRCVAIVGFPALNSKDILIMERCRFLTDQFNITQNDFIEFDAMRQTCQCLGRVMRGKSDYGLMLLIDKRFAQKSKLSKMPKWISKQLEQGCVNITSESALTIIRDFYRKMAQKFTLAPGSYFTEENYQQELKI